MKALDSLTMADVLGRRTAVKKWHPSDQKWKEHLWVLFGQPNEDSFKLNAIGNGE